MQTLAMQLATAALIAALCSGCALAATVAEVPSATPASSASAGQVTSPPGCLEARMAWFEPMHRLLLLNCVDQTDPDAVEEIWAWAGDRWSATA